MPVYSGQWEWTPERIEIVRRDWPTGVSSEGIERKLLALPGAVGKRQSISVKASHLGLLRPADFVARGVNKLKTTASLPADKATGTLPDLPWPADLYVQKVQAREPDADAYASISARIVIGRPVAPIPGWHA